MKKESGQALVEFGLMLIVLLLVLLFIFGAVFIIHNYLVLDRAVAKAGRQGSLGATDAQIIEIINTAAEALINTPILAGSYYNDQILIEVYDPDGNIVASGGRDDYSDVTNGNRLKITLFYETYLSLPFVSEVFNTRIPVSETVRIEQPLGGWLPPT